ncbi:fatty acid--CoA ligase family protein [Phenylobacterium sp.]|uniref:class I adenylate-forming enzyme family protein n=1 Tax=Phenylobacterium sp. TaxID=1871053 RepID=UPI00289E7AE6|nr:fatty acid--CoA ligase family protein [Phenylobacterium sp.]
MTRLIERFREVLALDSAAWALEFEGKRRTWGELAQGAEVVAQALAELGAAPHDVIGWAAHNSPSAVVSLIGLVLSESCTAVINPHMAPKILCDEIIRQRFPVIVGDPGFWKIPGVAAAAAAVGSAGMVVTWGAAVTTAPPHPGLGAIGAGPHREPMRDVVIERLSSGTTGPPKRSPQSATALINALRAGERREAGAAQTALTLKRSPAVVFRSLAHSGSFAVLLALYSARPILLQEKFTVSDTVDAIREHRPKVISLVPTAIKMIWDAQVPPEDLASLVAIRSGTAPLDVQLQAKFEHKYGVPILVDYGATEFGGVTSWSLEDHRLHAASKRGSVGRVVAGAEIRVRDAETGALIDDGRTGLLEVRVPRKGVDWISTNDLASVDRDGFLYIRGRADDAIVRGGFKILPDEVVSVLRQHPDVQDAAVVGIPDQRLGQVPVAVIETRPDAAAPDEAGLRAFAREHLTPYQVPVAFKFIQRLPRTASMKVIRSEVLDIALG